MSAIWLNLTPDHLDRHGSMTGYMRAKSRIFANMDDKDTAIVGIDEPLMQEVAANLVARGGPHVRTASIGGDHKADLYVDDKGMLLSPGKEIASFASLPTLRGAHNWQNAAMAFGAAEALGLGAEAILSAMASFPGLAHRMEVLGRRGRVLFVNDSKATNADAAAKALTSSLPRRPRRSRGTSTSPTRPSTRPT